MLSLDFFNWRENQDFFSLGENSSLLIQPRWRKIAPLQNLLLKRCYFTWAHGQVSFWLSCFKKIHRTGEGAKGFSIAVSSFRIPSLQDEILDKTMKRGWRAESDREKTTKSRMLWRKWRFSPSLFHNKEFPGTGNGIDWHQILNKQKKALFHLTHK